MTELHCHTCSRRIGRRGQVLVIADALVLCRACADDVAVHARFFIGCASAHSCRRHYGTASCTRGRAAQLLSGV